MSRARQKGTEMESGVEKYLQERFNDTEGTIHRAALHGAKDLGDIFGLWWRGRKVVVEVKNCRKFEPKEWLRQAEVERGNADAEIGVVVFHVNGIGLGNMGQQGVLMTLETFCKLIGGEVEGS